MILATSSCHIKNDNPIVEKRVRFSSDFKSLQGQTVVVFSMHNGIDLFQRFQM